MDPIEEIVTAAGGKATLHQLKDESGETVHSFATLSMPLRKDHWIYQKADDGFGFPPPMPLRIGADNLATIVVTEPSSSDAGIAISRTLLLNRRHLADMIRMAGKYAVRASTMHGSEMDFDPDAMLQNLVVGFLGYWTADGLGSEKWENPNEQYVPANAPPANPAQGNSAQVPE